MSSIEAEKFWPIFHAFDKNYLELRFKKLKRIKKNLKKESNMISESDALTKLNEIATVEDEITKLKLKFLSQLEGVISNKKILLLKIAEDEFNRRMMDRLKHRSKEQKRK